MPLPKRLARFNRRVTNHVTYPIARTLPGLGVVLHVGRRSGRSYRTPVNAFQTADGYVIALTYGVDSDWLKNVLAAGGCELLTRGTTVALTGPRLVHTERHASLPRVARVAMRLIGVRDFVELRRREY